MATNFTMPQLGLTMTEGTVAKWYKKVGERVEAGEVLAEISTDKITNQIESPVAGTVLAITVPEGGVAPVQAVLAVLGDAGEKVDAPAQAVAEAAAAVQAVPAVAGRVIASPYAKKLAAEKGVDLALVTGTGPGGRIVEKDVLAFAGRPAVPKASPLAAKVAAEHGVDLASVAAAGSRVMAGDVLAALPRQVSAGGQPLTGMRKVIAERMSLSWQTSPHVNLTVEVDMTAAGRLKERLAAAGGKYSYTEIIVKCAARALGEFPTVNASLQSGALVTHDSVNVGVAVALDNGLIVPVVRDAQAKTIGQIREDIAALGAKAREGRLGPDEYSGGTFTVTNLGMYGTDHFTPIINPPESAILGVCRIVKRPVVVDDAIVIRPMCNLCLSFDHRLVDGALAARFMARVRELLEEPLLLLN